MTVLDGALLDSTSCTALAAGTGSSKVLQKSTTGNVTTASVDLYYDGSCAQPYIEAAATLTPERDRHLSISELRDLPRTRRRHPRCPRPQRERGLRRASGATSSVTVDGTGTFTPKDGSPAGEPRPRVRDPRRQRPATTVRLRAAPSPSPSRRSGLSLGLGGATHHHPDTDRRRRHDDYSVAFSGTQSISESGAPALSRSRRRRLDRRSRSAEAAPPCPANATSGHAALFALFSRADGMDRHRREGPAPRSRSTS